MFYQDGKFDCKLHWYSPEIYKHVLLFVGLNALHQVLLYMYKQDLIPTYLLFYYLDQNDLVTGVAVALKSSNHNKQDITTKVVQ